MKKVLGFLGKLLIFLGVASAVGGIVFVVMTILQAPDLSEVDVRPEGYLTTVLDDEGETTVTLAGVEANRVYVDLDQIPENLQHAFVAIEDERFYTHHGIDLKGILRAVGKGILNGFHFSEGASTITQQLLKNNVFTDWTDENTFADRLTRKIQEQYLALKLEQRDSKEMILENYLNTINLGGGTWGVQAASKRYFGKDVSELTLSECAVVAGITKNPSAYNPINAPEKCRERQELVLKNMLDQGYITEDEYEDALSDDVFTRIAENHTDANAEVLSYFEDALVQQIISDMEERLGYTEAEAWDKLYRGGLTVCSTVDSELQRIAEEEAADDEHYDSDAQVSVVMTDVDTGEVKALVGGRGEKTASLVLNRATDSERQPGSTVKILGEYAAVLDQGEMTLGSVIDDAPYTYSNGQSITNAEGTYGGQTTVRKAIVQSLNIPALKAFQQAGLDTVWQYLQDFGLTSLNEADQVEALALGGTSGGVTNLEVTAAYNAVANGGKYIEPVFYTKILDHDGNVLLENEPFSRQVIREDTAALLTSAMEDVLTEGTGTKAYFEGYAIAGKSGTTTGSRDVWFVGYSTEVTCGIWGGYDDNREQDNGSYVKYLWKAIMKRACESESAGTSFDSETRLNPVTICEKCGCLAVSGLCDSTVQGDMTGTEYYVPGTEPTVSCTCHIAVDTCSESGQTFGTWCPESDRVTAVYLRTATEGTEDEDAVVPAESEETCSVHKYFWNKFGIGGNSGDGSGSGSTDPYGNDDSGSGHTDPYGNGDSGSGSTDPYGNSDSGSGSTDPYGNDDSGSGWWPWGGSGNSSDSDGDDSGDSGYSSGAGSSGDSGYGEDYGSGDSSGDGSFWDSVRDWFE